MAKFRANHQKSNVKVGMGRIIRFLLMVGVLGVLVWQALQRISVENTETENASGERTSETIILDHSSKHSQGSEGNIYQNAYFTLSYDEEHEQARWVAYTLTRENLNKKRLKRSRDFEVDRKIKAGSAHTKDYSHSGYTRGHLVPSADMSYSAASMAATYKMSNISPQLRNFNGGIWRELEEQTRDWARKFKRLYIVTGPILSDVNQKIGRNKVSVPKFFFKVLMDIDDPEKKAIGFIMPHEVSYKHLNKYAVTVDEVERITGLDFFDEVTSDQEEERLESKMNSKLWPFDNRRFEIRQHKWNKN